MTAYSVVSYRSTQATLDLVAAIRRQDQASSIYVRFNDGQPAPRVLKELSLAVCRVAPHYDNVGFGNGHLWAVAETPENEWVWIVNPDIEVSDSWCALAAEALSALPPDAALAGVPVHGVAMCREHRPYGIEAIKFVLGVFGVRVPRRRQFDALSQRPSPTYTVPGCLFALRKHSRLKTAFDPAIFMFFEEQVLAEQAYRAGLSAWLLPGLPAAIHKQGLSRRGLSPSMRREFVRSQTVYLQKYMGWNPLLCRVLGYVTWLRLLLSRGV